MKFLKTPPFFILAIGLVFAQSAWAHPKDVEPSGAGPRPNAVRPYKTSSATLNEECFLFGDLRSSQNVGDCL